MKQLVFAFFIVLACSIVTGGAGRNKSNETALQEMISATENLKKIEQGSWGTLSPSIKKESICILKYFKKGLKDLKNLCKLIPEREMCEHSTGAIRRNLSIFKSKQCPPWKYENRNFTEFIDHLLSFLQQNIRS